MRLGGESAPYERRHLPPDRLEIPRVVPGPHHRHPMCACGALDGPNKGPGVAVILDACGGERHRVEGELASVADPSHVRLQHSDLPLAHLVRHIGEVCAGPQPGIGANFGQPISDSCQDAQVAGEDLRSFAIPTTVSVIDEHPAQRHVRIDVPLCHCEGNIRVVVVPVVVVAIRITQAQAVDWRHKGPTRDVRVALQKCLEVPMGGHNVEGVEALLLVREHGGRNAEVVSALRPSGAEDTVAQAAEVHRGGIRRASLVPIVAHCDVDLVAAMAELAVLHAPAEEELVALEVQRLPGPRPVPGHGIALVQQRHTLALPKQSQLHVRALLEAEARAAGGLQPDIEVVLSDGHVQILGRLRHDHLGGRVIEGAVEGILHAHDVLPVEDCPHLHIVLQR
mmetsp:Transcript_74212/g.241351  ORF Transcript_74212/g.241351 Transcript_74212/m.241351 type:complete len:395 (+) Transcript_74212:1479-2663(+)